MQYTMMHALLRNFHLSHPIHSWSQLMLLSYTQSFCTMRAYEPWFTSWRNTSIHLPQTVHHPHIGHIILNFIFKHTTFKFMDTDIPQILGTTMGSRMVPPWTNLFISKAERTIILTILLLEAFYWWYCLHFPRLPLSTQILDDIHEYNQLHH